jgi:hypothetical protein
MAQCESVERRQNASVDSSGSAMPEPSERGLEPQNNYELQAEARPIIALHELRPIQRSAHGWRGNTTDERSGRPNFHIPFFIRGIATPSVGITSWFTAAVVAEVGRDVQ